MPNDLNVFDTTEWERDVGGARGTRVGAAAGARALGCTLYERDPQGQAAPYHVHHGNEELLPSPPPASPPGCGARARRRARSAMVAFPTGSGGAHRLRNASDAPARHLLLSTMALTMEALQADPGS